MKDKGHPEKYTFGVIIYPISRTLSVLFFFGGLFRSHGFAEDSGAIARPSHAISASDVIVTCIISKYYPVIF